MPPPATPKNKKNCHPSVLKYGIFGPSSIIRVWNQIFACRRPEKSDRKSRGEAAVLIFVRELVFEWVLNEQVMA